jgi:hypothetical protein
MQMWCCEFTPAVPLKGEMEEDAAARVTQLSDLPKVARYLDEYCSGTWVSKKRLLTHVAGCISQQRPCSNISKTLLQCASMHHS